MVGLRSSGKAHMAGHFDCLVGTEGLLTATGSHVHCKCGNASETVDDRDVATTEH